MRNPTDTFSNQSTPGSSIESIELKKLGKQIKFYGYMLLLTLIIGIFGTLVLVSSVYSMVFDAVQNNITYEEFARGLINMIIMTDITSIVTLCILIYAIVRVLRVAVFFKVEYRWLYLGFMIVIIHYLASLSYAFVLLGYSLVNFNSLAAQIASAIHNVTMGAYVDPNLVLPSYFPLTNKGIDLLMAAGLAVLYEGFADILAQHPERKSLENIPLLLVIAAVLVAFGTVVDLAGILGAILLIYIFIKAGGALETPPFRTSNYPSPRY